MERPQVVDPPSSVEGAPRPAVDGAAAVPVVRTRLELPPRTIVTVILTLAALWLLLQLWPLLVLVIVAALLAAALEPVVSRLGRRGWPRPLSVGLIVLALVGVLALIGLLVVPPAIEEGGALAQDLPDHVEDARDFLNANPSLFGPLRDAASAGSANPQAIATGVLRVGANVVDAIVNAFLVLVLMIYLLLDGRRVVDWVLRYVPAGHRVKTRRALPEVGRVISGYVLGQAITSALFGVFSFVVLTALGVPQPLLLALLAAVMDAIPIAGILIATVPAVLLAATVSWPTAGIVLVAYVAYQQVENYLIVPRIYRGTLQISSFTVLIAVLIGGQLLGILGVLLALPIAAAIPVIERVWREEAGHQAAPAAATAGS